MVYSFFFKKFMLLLIITLYGHGDKISLFKRFEVQFEGLEGRIEVSQKRDGEV